jgi:ABC-type transporter Mla subunit MlaD
MKQQNVRTLRKATPRKATTFRLEPNVQQRLVLIGKVLKVPLNRLVNEAVEVFVSKRTAEIATTMEQTLKLLKASRAEDPDFERAIAEFADSEANYAKADPAEGAVEPRRGPVQARVHKLLHG